MTDDEELMAAKTQRRRESDPRIEAIEREIEVIHATVSAGEVAFKAHEQSEAERWERRSAQLDEMQKSLAAIAAYKPIVDDTAKDTAKLMDTVYGNGKPGMTVEIDRLIHSVDLLVRVAWIIIGVFVVSGLGAIIAHFVAAP